MTSSIQKILISILLLSTALLGYSLELTEKERIWLESNPVVRVQNEADWAPINFNRNGEPMGMSIDLMSIVSERTGLRVEYATGSTWIEYLEMMRDGELDILLNAVKTEDRLEYLDFTDPYLRNPNSIVVNKSSNPISGLGDLTGKTLAVPEGFYLEALIKQDYPEISILEVPDTSEGLNAVSAGSADALISKLMVVRYLLAEEVHDDLMVGAEADFGNPEFKLLNVAVRPDNPELLSIINKVIASISEREYRNIRERWVDDYDQYAIYSAPYYAEFQAILSPAESSWLKQKGDAISFGHIHQPPYVIANTVNGEVDGLIIDYLNLLGDRFGLLVSHKIAISRDDLDTMLDTGTIDGYSWQDGYSIGENQVQTNPFLSIPYHIVSRSIDPDLEEISDLARLRTAVIDSRNPIEEMEKPPRKMTVLTYPGPMEVFQALSISSVNAAMLEGPVARFYSELAGASNYRISRPSEFGTGYGIVVGQENDHLKSILDKAFTASEKAGLEAMNVAWGVQSVAIADNLVANDALRFLISWLIPFATGTVLFILIIGLIRRVLSRQKGENRRSRTRLLMNLGIIMMVICIPILLVVSWGAIRNTRRETESDLSNSISTILGSTRNSLTDWIEDSLNNTREIAEENQLIDLTEDLLTELQTDSDGTRAFGSFRRFVESTDSRLKLDGVSIISPDGTVIASSFSRTVGTEHPASVRTPKLLGAAFDGQGIFVPPIRENDDNSSASLFFLQPIKGNSGEIISVLAIHNGPNGEFSSILRQGRVGFTGDVYAFDSQGRMLSTSRFEQDVIDSGLIGDAKSTILNLELREPVDGLAVENRPLTRMARSAVSGETGIDMAGYRDYRGIEVIGTWTWLDSFGFGITMEIETEEVKRPFITARNGLYTVVGIAIALLIVITIINEIIGNGSIQILARANDDLEQRVSRRTKELEEAEERSRLLLNSIGEGLFGVNTNGQITFINPAALKLLGYEENELLGREIHDIIHHSHLDGQPYDVADCPMRAAFTEGRESVVSDEVLWKKDGNSFFVNYISTPIRKAETIIGAVVSFMDVSAQKQVEGNLEMMFQGSPMPMFISEPESRIIIRCNPAFADDMGIDVADAVGRKNQDFLYDDVLTEEQQQAAVSAAWTEIRFRGKTEDSFRTALMSVRAIEYEGSRAFIGSYIDISLIKDAQEQMKVARELAENATKAKSDFLANMSHEIRTPMNAVIGLSHLALQTALTPKQQDYLSKIQRSADNLLGIINDILDFSKIDAGKLSIENTDFDLNDVLQNLSAVIGPKAHEKGLIYSFSWDPKVPRFLIGDPLRIGQILLNLSSNAVKFTEKGEVELIIDRVSDDDDGCLVKFTIRDTGIGLKKDQLDKLFEAFNQADTSITRRYGGTGLGLSISKKLAELMGGEIGVESSFGDGSTFWATVRLKASDKVLGETGNLPEDIKAMRILVCSSHEATRKLLSRYITDFDMGLVAVSDESGATRAMKKAEDEGTPLSILIADHYSGGSTGLSLVSNTKRNLGPKELKTILLIDYGQEGLSTEAEAAGVNSIILKPVTQSALFDSIMNAVAGKIPSRSIKKKYTYKYSDGTRARLLLVEDNEINQQVASELLEGAGFDVEIADNGAAAVEKVSRFNYDLVFMDLQMPIMDGYTATARIRDNGHPKLPIIAQTADAMTGVEERVLESGMNAYITKPIDPERLFDTLSKFLPELIREEIDIQEGDRAPGLESWQKLIDYESAVQRVGGNQEIFLGIVKRFVRDYADFPGKFAEAVSESGQTAERLAHSLKGVAGNIGAAELSALAAELEKSIRENVETGNLGPELLSIEKWISDFTVQFTKDYRDETGSGDRHDESDARPLEQAELAELSALMGDFKPAAKTKFAELELALRKIDPDRTLEIKKLLEKYDFMTAQEVLKTFEGKK